MAEKTLVSVIICTYNRCESLRDTLDTLINQKSDGSFDYEVIIIDNNSNDMTKETVGSYMFQFKGKLRYIFEPKQGLSYARNRGLKEATGEIIAFTDDDVIVDSNWLNNIYLHFSKYNCDALAGKSLPLWEQNKPSWLSKKCYPILALLDYGNETFQIESRKNYFVGCNFIIKKRIFDELGYFNENFGRKGLKLLSGEEVELFDSLVRAKKIIYYNPTCIVYHKVSAERMKKAYFRKWNFYYGQSSLETKESIYKVRVIKTFYYLLIELFCWLYCSFRKNEECIINHEINFFYYLGQLKWKLNKFFNWRIVCIK